MKQLKKEKPNKEYSDNVETTKNNESLTKIFTEIFDERFKPIKESLKDLAKKVIL